TVLIWTQDTPDTPWQKKALCSEKFAEVVWRVSWSLSGNILAVSCGDNKVTLWKENLNGGWECVSEMEEKTQGGN
ncbi:GTPase-activating protein S13, partial [Mortierella sp. NVP85]